MKMEHRGILERSLWAFTYELHMSGSDDKTKSSNGGKGHAPGSSGDPQRNVVGQIERKLPRHKLHHNTKMARTQLRKTDKHTKRKYQYVANDTVLSLDNMFLLVCLLLFSGTDQFFKGLCPSSHHPPVSHSPPPAPSPVR